MSQGQDHGSPPSGGPGDASAGSGEPGTGRSTSAARKADPLLGQVVDGRFRVVRVLARGGMGKIYEAVQEPLGRTVALKVMDLGYSEDLDPGFKRRFFLEAATCAGLNHPNTVRVFDYGSSGELYFIVMELLQGRTLLKVIDDGGPIDAGRTLRIARQVAGSLSEAHAKGVVHRDLKPSNILLCQHADQEDFAKVLDFGLVKLIREDADEFTKAGMFLGSPNYMSPEQIRAGKLDGRSDLYSLGVVLYMCLTGHSPFKRDSSVNVLVAQLEENPPTFETVSPGLGVPRIVEQIVMCCLEKDPERRFRSADELNRALRAAEQALRGEIPWFELQLVDGRVVVPAEASELTGRSKPLSGPSGIHRLPAEASATPGRVKGTPSGPRPLPGAIVPAPESPSPGPDHAPRDDTPATGHGVATQTAVAPPPTPDTPAGRPSWAPWALLGLAAVLVAVLVVLTGIEGERPAPGGATDVRRGAVEAPLVAGPVLVRSLPPDASVVRDGLELGRTPIELDVPTGEQWSVQVRLDGYVTRVLHLRSGDGPIDAVLSTDGAPSDPGEPRPPRSGGAARPADSGTAPAAPRTEPTPEAPTPRPPGSDLRDPWSG